MNDTQDQSSPPQSTDDTQSPDASTQNATSTKTYKRPTISRHGNLRLMTQLE